MGSALHIVKEGVWAAGRFLKLLFWVKDEEAEKAAWLREAEETKKRLLQLATDKIAPLQDAVDLEEATDEEKARLNAWKKYRVLVNRVDTSKPEWPEAPSAWQQKKRFNVANTGKPLKRIAAKKSVSKLPYLPASVETHAAKFRT